MARPGCRAEGLLSWAAHDLEPYAIQRHSRLKIAFVPLLFGSYSPDLMSKWFVYGIHIGGLRLKASDPTTFHRGWPGLGFTHSLLYGLVIAFIFWRLLGSKTWGISFLIGQWAHAITDTGDTVGTMLFFPWTVHIHFGAWAYAGQTGRLTDAAAYFSGPGAVWDLVWIVYGIFSWRVLTRSYFEEHVFTADKFWSAANRILPITALLVLYRAAFFYGTSRWIAWSLWAHVVHHYPYDLSWGGPHWVHAAHVKSLSWPQMAGVGGIVAAGFAIAWASRLQFVRRTWAASRSKTRRGRGAAPPRSETDRRQGASPGPVFPNDP